MSNDELAAINATLKRHKEQIEKAHAEGLAVQMLLIGLMNALIKRGVDRSAIDEAFECGAGVAMTATERLKSQQATWTLNVIDQLRQSIVQLQ